MGLEFCYTLYICIYIYIYIYIFSVSACYTMLISNLFSECKNYSTFQNIRDLSVFFITFEWNVIESWDLRHSKEKR